MMLSRTRAELTASLGEDCVAQVGRDIATSVRAQDTRATVACYHVCHESIQHLLGAGVAIERHSFNPPSQRIDEHEQLVKAGATRFEVMCFRHVQHVNIQGVKRVVAMLWSARPPVSAGETLG
jgi:hypothetical protein